jgi:ketosteroid isomerase-like protein
MSGGNVEILRRVYEASQIDGAEGVEAVLSCCSDDVVWVSDPRLPGGGTHEGRDAVRDYLNGLSVFESVTVDIEEITDLGERALGITTFHGRPPQGPEVEWVWCHLVSVRDGLITEARSFMDADSARRAAGLLD